MVIRVSARFWAFFVSFAAAGVLAAAEYVPGTFNAPGVFPASDEGETAIKRFRVPKGFKVELVAAEPHPLLAFEVLEVVDHEDAVARGDAEDGQEPDQGAERHEAAKRARACVPDR